MPDVIRAALFDFGGVIVDGPFEAFARLRARARSARRADPAHQRHRPRHQRLGPPRARRGRSGRVRRAVRGRGPRPWASTVDGRAVLGLLAGTVVGGERPAVGRLRPAMVEAVRRCSERLVTGLLTNNFRPTRQADGVRAGARATGLTAYGEVLALFDVRHRVEPGRGAQARSPLLRDRLRHARDRAVRGRLPRRPRRQPQAGPGHGHDDHQGRRPRRRPGRARAGRRASPSPDPT